MFFVIVDGFAPWALSHQPISVMIAVTGAKAVAST
jgi:hypothetical protein